MSFKNMIRKSKTKTKVWQLFLVVIFLCNFWFTGLSKADTPLTTSTWEPTSETKNLLHTGSLTQPYITNLTYTMDYLVLIKIHMHFSTNTLEWLDFGADPALANGFNIKLDGHFMFINESGQSNIDKNYEFFHYFDSVDVEPDQTSPKGYLLTAEKWFSNDHYPSALPLVDKDIHVYLYDDMTALTNLDVFLVDFEGYNVTSTTVLSTVYLPGTQQIHGSSVHQNPLDQINQFAIDNQQTILGLLYYILAPLLILSIFLIYRRRKR